VFERYTEKARRVIFQARYEAIHYGSPNIETEHLLLGILREAREIVQLLPQGSDASIRNQIDVSTIPYKRLSPSVDLPLSNGSKRVLAYGAEEAERLGHHHIGTEHLLLGLLRENACFGAMILRERGLALDQLRETIGKSPLLSSPPLAPLKPPCDI
jgi:ATP-dependent Clp protease ATP-binding subunit ClpC